jgi:tetratricopeptide (TPR) repeat protein
MQSDNNKIMKAIRNIFILFFFLSSIHATAMTDAEAMKIYHEANIAYQKLDYEKCIQLYEQLVKNKHVSPEVYFNLGNAYFKAGNFAKAILNYERTKKLTPDDEDVNFNLKIASLKVIDKIESVPEIFYKRWINSLSTLLTSDTFTIIFILMVWLLFVSAAFYVIGQSVFLRKISFFGIIIFLLLSIAGGVIAARSHAIMNVDKQGIIMTSSVYVKSSPDEKGNDLFILHEGTKVDVMDVLNNWRKIRIANGSIGWMKAEEMEII